MIFENDKITYRNIARGLFFRDDSILLAKDIRQGHHFPPGGGVDFGESIENALVREFEEELGWKTSVSSFIGCLEHSWRSKRNNFETNFYFILEVIEGDIDNPISKEDHLKFEWIKLSSLDELTIFPKDILPNLIRNAQNNTQSDHQWFSTIK